MVLKTWFRANPDPEFRRAMRDLYHSPVGKTHIRTKLNEARLKMGRPFISEREFERLYNLLLQGVNA